MRKAMSRGEEKEGKGRRSGVDERKWPDIQRKRRAKEKDQTKGRPNRDNGLKKIFVFAPL